MSSTRALPRLSKVKLGASPGALLASAVRLRVRGFVQQQRHEVRLSLHENFISELQSLHAGAALSAVRQSHLDVLASLAEEGRVAAGNDLRLRALTAGAQHGLAEKKEETWSAQGPARPRTQRRSRPVEHQHWTSMLNIAALAVA